MIESQQDGDSIDASTFQKPLHELAETLAQKVRREAPERVSPSYVATDLHVLVRQTMYIYNLFFYINADERREGDYAWRPAYGIVTFPLVRNMIDTLYNITTILQNPSINGPLFRKSGYVRAFEAFDDNEKKYGGRPEWDEWLEKGRAQVELGMRVVGIQRTDLANEKWPTLGAYVKTKHKGGTTTPHQEFLKTFHYVQWREYSAMAHGAFDGLLATGLYFVPDTLPYEERPKLDEAYPRIMTRHMARAAAILLCIVTELQGHFRFDGANINERIHEIWNALIPIPEIRELYLNRYEQFMKDKRIEP